MRILILSQLYYPDTASVAQHVGDLSFALVEAGHEVTVFAGDHAYEDPQITYPASETIRGVRVERISHSALGKSSKLTRLIDFASFNIKLFFKTLGISRKQYDVVLGLTAPPLMSFIGVMIAKWKGLKFGYWTMDLQPELAIQAGYIKKGSLPERVLSFMGDYTFKRSDFIIALDSFMGEHIVRRGAKPENIHVHTVWPVVPSRYTGTRLDNPFRKENAFGDKIVVMYSGNHAVVHPLDTLLEAALRLRNDDRFLFVFIGGGVRKQDVTDFKAKHNMESIVQLPYQPRENIPFSLGSSDLQVVILGDGYTGYTHPNKIYGAIYVGKPVLYIGPSPSHVSQILDACPGNIAVEHGQVDSLVAQLQAFAAMPVAEQEAVGERNLNYAEARFAPEVLIRQHIGVFEKHQ